MNLAQDGDTGPSPQRGAPPTSVGFFDRSSLVAALMGLGACLLTGGLVARFGALFKTADPHRIGVSGAFFCLALGSLLPHRLAALLGGGRRAASADGLATARDQTLLCAVLAIVALLSGLSTALLPAWAPIAESGYRWALASFLWPQWSLPLVQLFAVVLVSVTPLALAGMTLSCVCRAACPLRDWCISPLAWAVVGAATGLGLLEWWAHRSFTADAVCQIAAVPMLLAAVVAASRLRAGGEVGTPVDWEMAESVPDLRDRQPLLIRFAVVWLAVGTAMVVIIWPRVAIWWSGEMIPGGPTALILLLVAAVACGLIACERSGSWRSHSAGGFAMACAASGVAVGLAAALPACWPGPHLGVSWWAALLSAGALSGFLMGFSLAYGHLAVLRRVGHRAPQNSSLLAATIAAWGVAVLLLEHRSVTAGVAYALLAAGAVSLVALGGMTLIHEPTCSPQTRRRRLAAIFVAILLIIGLLPVAGRQWSTRVRHGDLSVQADLESGSPIAVAGAPRQAAEAAR